MIGLAGKVAVGKTTIAGFLSQQFGFEHVRSRDVLVRLLEDQGLPVDDDSLQDLGARIIKERGPHAVWELLRQAQDLSHSCVIDSLRYTSDYAFFREKFGDNFKLVFLVAPDEVRRERFLNRAGREATESGFQARTLHEVERDVPNLLDKADAALANVDLNDVTAQLAALVLRWTYGSRPTAMKEMIEAVTEFHRKHGFDIGTRDRKVMQYRMGLLVEELGEINECFSKGRGDITEEHADLLILLLGNCITMGIDLETAFWKKYAKIMKRPAKRVGDTIRVSHWRTGSAASFHHGYFHVNVEQLLRTNDEDDTNEPVEPVQPSLFE